MTSAIDMAKIVNTRTFDGRGDGLFLPRPWLEVDQSAVRRDQPVRTAAGQLYRCEYLYRLNEASVFARGSVRDPDNRSIRLPYWHRVVSSD